MDVIIIGGGPGGYVAAIRAAQMGGKVKLVEEDKLGGTCLNRGCIPTKFMLRSVETFQSVKNAERYGVNVSGASFDLDQMQASKQGIVSQLNTGIGGLLKGNGVEVLNGRGRLTGANQVTVTLADGKQETLTADRIIIATGCRPIELPIPGADSPDILSVDDLLTMEKLPKSIAVIGGGVVGVELATFMAKLGSEVSIIEMMPQCLPTQDCEISGILHTALEKDGISVYAATRVMSITDRGGKKVVATSSESQPEVEADNVVIAVGYRPNTADMGFEECGLELERGAIVVNNKMETNLPGVYAVGDAVGGVMLAHVAQAEGIVAVENALGGAAVMNYDVIPSCIFCLPEVGCVGLSEDKAKEACYDVDVGRFSFAANGMAKIVGETMGMVKIVADKKYGQILGAHIIGPQATNLISEISAAMKLEATVDDIVGLVHSHPSLSEAIWEAAADISGKAIHSISRRRG